MSLILGFIGVLCLALIGIGILGAFLLVAGAVAFMESGSLLGLGVAIVGLALIFAMD